MNDLYKAINALNDIIKEAPGDETPSNNVEYDSFADFLKAIQTPGRQGKTAREKVLDRISPEYMADLEKRKYLDPEAYDAFWDAELNREGYSEQEKAVVAALKQQMDLPFGSKPFDGSYDKDTTKLVNITDPKTGEKKTFAVPREPDVPEFAKVGPDGQYDGDDLGNAPTTPVAGSADVEPGDFEVPAQYAGDDTDDTQPKDKPRDGGNPGGTTTTASQPKDKPKPARVTYQSLAKASGIEDPDKIRPGQEIKLPNGGVYKVKSGDTLGQIAQDVRLGKIADKSATKPDIAATANDKDGIRRVPQAQPKDKPRDGGNPGGTTKTATVDPTKKVRPDTPKVDEPTKVAQTPVQTGGDRGEFDVEIANMMKNAGVTSPSMDYTQRYKTLPDGSIVANPDFKDTSSKPSDFNKPNKGPMYEPLDKDAQTDLQKAQQIAKNVDPNLNVAQQTANTMTRTLAMPGYDAAKQKAAQNPEPFKKYSWRDLVRDTSKFINKNKGKPGPTGFDTNTP